MSIWRKNKITGYWLHEKKIELIENAKLWLCIFQEDFPNEWFVLAKHRPKL